MADLSIPDVVHKDYLKKNAAALEKSTKLTPTIVELHKAFDAIDLKMLDLSKVKVETDAAKAAKQMQDLTAQLGAKCIRPLQQMLAGPLKKVEDEANKALGDAKKAGCESAVRAIISALKPFRSQVNALIESTAEELEGLAKGVKKEPATKGDDAADKKKNEALNKQILRYNMMAKKAVRELRSGKLKSVPFVFAANKIKVPYKKGKDWTAKSLLHIHMKAGQSSRNILAKLIDLPSPVFAIGEIRCEDRKKLIFDCTKTPPANVKQLKDALLFQCGFAPALKVMKGSKVEGDEAGEGEDSGEAIPDIPEDDEDEASLVAAAPTAPTAKQPGTAKEPAGKGGEAAGNEEKADPKVAALKDQAKKQFTKRSDDIKKAVLAGDKKAKEVKALAIKVAEQIGEDGDGNQASELMNALDELLDTPSEVVTAAADAIGAAAANPELQQALRDLVTLRTRAVAGVTRVAELIRKAYQGDPQAAKAIEGANKVDGAKRLLTPAVETQIAALLNVADPARRASMASAARASVGKYRQEIASHDLLPDVDKNDFDPNMNVIAPYLAMLQRAETLLGNIKA
jgi:hypothetical protein